MKKLITRIVGVCLVASFMGCSSTGRFNSTDYATRMDSLEQFETTWEMTGQPQIDVAGQSLVIRWEESRDVMFAAIDRSGNLAILNKISLSCEQNFKAEGIENPTEEEMQQMINDIVAGLTEEDQRYVGEYYATHKLELEQADDDGKEIAGIIFRLIPVVKQAIDRYKTQSAVDLVGSLIGGEGKAILNGLDQLNTLKDWNDNCLELIEAQTTMAMQLQSGSKFNKLQMEGR